MSSSLNALQVPSVGSLLYFVPLGLSSHSGKFRCSILIDTVSPQITCCSTSLHFNVDEI